MMSSTACARHHIEKELTPPVISFVHDSVPLERTADLTRFTVSVIIRNDGASPIDVGGCGPEAQRQIGGRWQTVWTPVCISPQWVHIAPGDSFTFPLTVAGFTRQGFHPPLDPRMTAGTYRLGFGVSRTDRSNPAATTRSEFVGSPPFVVYALMH
jgi:hypothetical protein